MGIEIILVPFSNIVKAEEGNLFENGVEMTQQEMAPIIGKLAAVSQGANIKNTPTFMSELNELGNNIINNALTNGKRYQDLLVKTGNSILFNPNNVMEELTIAWKDFHSNKFSWETENSYTQYVSVFSPSSGGIALSTNQSFDAYSIKLIGTGFQSSSLFYREPGRTHPNYNRSFNSVTSTMATVTSPNIIGNVFLYATDGLPMHITRYTVYANGYIDYGIPFEEPPATTDIKQKFSSTFSEGIPTETNPENSNVWYQFDEQTFIDESIIINDTYITNNYSTVIYEGDTINEGDTIVHEADEEGSGSFWGALLDLISTFISTIGGLLESVINAIGNIVPSIIDFFNNALIPRESYFKDNFTEIQTKAEEKAPDFEPVTQVLSAFDTTDQPSTWDGIQVNIPAFGINNITIVDPIMIDRYGRQIKTWVRMILLLMTSLVLIKRVSQVMGK